MLQPLKYKTTIWKSFIKRDYSDIQKKVAIAWYSMITKKFTSGEKKKVQAEEYAFMGRNWVIQALFTFAISSL